MGAHSTLPENSSVNFFSSDQSIFERHLVICIHDKLSICLYLILSFDPKIKEKPTLTPSSLNIQHKIFWKLGYYPFFNLWQVKIVKKALTEPQGRIK